MYISRKLKSLFFFAFFQVFICTLSSAQMRQVYIDQFQQDNQVFKCSFYSPSQGFVAFRDWVGYTTDSGRTFTKKYITIGNVNYNGYPVNLTFGFGIRGLKAFDQNTIIVYGDYGLVPAILYSSDGGSTYTLVFHSIYNDFNLALSYGITDMVFPQNGLVGYAVDLDRILKTTNGGITWSVARLDPLSYFNHLEAVDDFTVFAFSTEYNNNKLLKTTNGTNWQSVTRPALPNGQLVYTHFLTANRGWIGMYDNNSHTNFYTTLDGGTTWTKKNATDLTGFGGYKMKFINDSTGFALGGQNTVYKTTNGGAIWEPLPRDNNYAYLGYTHNDLQLLNGNQLWAGGGHGFLEMSTNGGGTPLPKAFFKLDTLIVPGTVSLQNYSRTNYQYTWLLNGSLLSTAYNASYTHQQNRTFDTIQLIVNNGLAQDTATLIQYFWVPAPPIPTISSFTPITSYSGATVTINGTNFSGTTSVKFGGTDAASFTIVSPTQIKAVIGTGSTGSVAVTTPFGTASRPGFVSLSPVITSFSPTSGGYNTVIQIRGKSLSGSSIKVQFGGYQARSRTITGDTLIDAVVGYAVSGNVTVSNDVYGTATLPGFTYLAAPVISSFSPVSAKQGDTVVINGAGFNAVNNVKFGGVDATYFSVVSSSIIKAVVGAAKSGYVTIYATGGTPTLNGFVYLSPLISSFSPAIGGPGATIQITGQNFTNVTGITVNGIAVASFAVNTDKIITAILGAGTGDGSGAVVVTTSAGTISKNGFQVFTAPVIYSFTPKAAPAGSLVTITGANFNTDAAANIVYFGAVRAAVNSATANLLTVTVPAGATYQPITVIAGGLSASSTLPFLLTATPWQITKNSFADKAKYAIQNKPSGLVAADFDNDGKADLVTRSGDTMNIFRNTSVRGSISLSPKIDIIVPRDNIGYGTSITVADLDGDGKQDVVISTTTGMSVLRNTSTGPGSITFANPFIYTTVSGYYVSRSVAQDLDGDGKPDLVLILGNSIEIVKNTSTTGNINFNAGTQISSQFTYNLYPLDIAVADMNADGRPEIIISKDYNGNNGSFAYFTNRSTVNNIVFTGPVSIGPPGQFPSIAVADINNDNIPDVLTVINAYYTSSNNTLNITNAVIYHQNTLVVDTNIIAAGQTIPTAPYPGKFLLGSLNGDDKPDMFVSGRFGSDGQTMLLNGSSASVVAFTGSSFSNDLSAASGIVLADLDGDGKTDIATASVDSSFISIFRNKAGEPENVCPGGNTKFVSNIAGTNYQWQKNSDGINFNNIIASANYAGVNDDTLVINAIADSLANARYRCIVDGNASQTFQIGFKNKWTGAVNNTWENAGNWSCGSIPNKLTDVVIESGNIAINSNDTIRSITINTGASVVVSNGFQLTVSGNASGNNFTDYFLVNTKTLSGVTNTTAECGGIISNDFESSSIIARGVVWSTSPNPLVSLSTKTVNGTGNGSYTSSITGLLPNSTYYARAYATTNNGTGYGEQLLFTTGGLPVLVTSAVSSVGFTTAVCGGNISSNAGSAVIAAGVVWSFAPNPTIALATKTVQSVAGGTFASNITLLVPDRTYYIRAYATNAVGTAYGNEYSFTTPDSIGLQTVSIGNQIWMKNNLNVSRYRNGDIIPHVTNAAQWRTLTTGAWRWYNDDSATYAATYGKLYNWYAVTDSRGLAPEGWHVPSETEFSILRNCVDDNTGYLKEVGSAHWQAPNVGANNITGFTALPGGYMAPYNIQGIGSEGYWWSTSAYSVDNGWGRRIISSSSTYFGSFLFSKTSGLSVRCIQD